MTDNFDTDVAIIGYGPTGILAALTLAENGVSAVALERDCEIYPRARAVTVNDWTMRIFQDLGIDERIEKVIEQQRALRWVTYDGHEIMRVEQPPSTLGRRPRFYNIYQPVMEAKLRECAADHGDRIDVRYGAEVTGVDSDAGGVTVTAKDTATGETTTVRARYAIAADGGSSAVRKQLGITMTGDTLDVQWIVIDCKAKRWWPDRDLLTFWSDSERPVVDIALSAGNHRWEMPLKPGETPEDFPTEDQVWPLLNALGKTSDDVDIHQYAFYRHHTRMADRWREGRVFLAGDAAHLMPPWAGAGMQTGMRDAHNLGWKLARVIKGELDERWLDTYEADRRPSAAFYTALSVELGRIIKQELSEEEQAALDASNTAPPDPKSADQDWPPEPPLIAPPVLGGGWLRGPLATDSIVGRMIPQPVAGDNVGTMGRLDDHLRRDFVLLGDNVDPATLLTPDEKKEWDALGARYVAVRPQNAYTQAPTDLVDLERVILPWMRRYGARAIAVRPDKFVAAADVSGLAAPEL